MEKYLENHCGKHGCFCTHTEPCERGFIWVEYYEDKVVKLPDNNTRVTSERYEAVRFCPSCDPERAHIQDTSKTTWEMYDKLQARGKAQKVKAYEESESSKTRTL